MKFAWRRTNNLQNVGYGRLLFESRSQFALTRLFGTEKPSVLDGDDTKVFNGSICASAEARSARRRSPRLRGGPEAAARRGRYVRALGVRILA
jgi:hypothetical protein